MIRAYTYKLFRSPFLYISIFGIAALCFSVFLDDSYFGLSSVSYDMEIFLALAQYRNCIILFAALPFAANFADEWNCGIAKECIVRKGVKKYAVSNLLFCWFTAVITVFLGMWIFMLIDSIFVPWSYVTPNPSSFIFEEYLYSGQGKVYLFFATVIFASSCAAWSIIGMLVSVFFTNKFVALCMPLIGWYFLFRITSFSPYWINLHDLALCAFPYKAFNSNFLGFLYSVGVFIAIAAVCGTAFYFALKRKVQNELT